MAFGISPDVSPPAREPDEIQISIAPTPNPDALMFRLEETLVPTGTYEYETVAAAAEAPLAARLLGIDGVDLVLIAPRFVTVRKRDDAGWPAVVPEVKQRLRAFLAAGEMAVLDTAISATPAATTQAELKILRLLDDEIRPAIASDGGDVTYMGFDDGIVKLRLIGSCGSCPSSVSTLKWGIERLLMEEVPEVKGVEQV